MPTTIPLEAGSVTKAATFSAEKRSKPVMAQGRDKRKTRQATTANIAASMKPHASIPKIGWPSMTLMTPNTAVMRAVSPLAHAPLCIRSIALSLLAMVGQKRFPLRPGIDGTPQVSCLGELPELYYSVASMQYKIKLSAGGPCLAFETWDARCWHAEGVARYRRCRCFQFIIFGCYRTSTPGLRIETWATLMLCWGGVPLDRGEPSV
jgi:hypothetical protein